VDLAEPAQTVMRFLGAREEPAPARSASGKGVKAGAITLVGLAGLVAVSGGVSALRRRSEARKQKASS
jgi:hypothetical protein